MLITYIAVFLDRLGDDVLEVGVQIGIETNGERGRAIQDGIEDDARGLAAKRQDAGGHFVQHNAKGKEIGALIERFATHLFRRHIGHGAQCRPRTGEQVFFIDRKRLPFQRIAGAARRGKLREPEIQNLCMSVVGDEDVGGLDVAMNDSGRVCRAERVGDLAGEGEQRFVLQRPARDQVPQGFPVKELHDEVGVTILLTDVVDGADVRMAKRRGGLGFTPKTSQRLRVARNTFRQEFEGNKAAQARVLRFVDHTHPATAELLDDTVVRDGLADHSKRNVRGWNRASQHGRGWYTAMVKIPPGNP